MPISAWRSSPRPRACAGGQGAERPRTCSCQLSKLWRGWMRPPAPRSVLRGSPAQLDGLHQLGPEPQHHVRCTCEIDTASTPAQPWQQRPRRRDRPAARRSVRTDPRRAGGDPVRQLARSASRGGVSPMVQQLSLSTTAAPLARGQAQQRRRLATRRCSVPSLSARCDDDLQRQLVQRQPLRRRRRCPPCACDLQRQQPAQVLAGRAGLERQVRAARGRGRRSGPTAGRATTMDTDIEASVPMLRMYSRCTGETLRSAREATGRARAASGAPVGGQQRHRRVVGVRDQPDVVDAGTARAPAAGMSVAGKRWPA